MITDNENSKTNTTDRKKNGGLSKSSVLFETPFMYIYIYIVYRLMSVYTRSGRRVIYDADPQGGEITSAVRPHCARDGRANVYTYKTA